MRFFQVFQKTKPIWWRRPLIKPYNEYSHRQASWLELFFDLVFVAAMAELSHMLLHSFQDYFHFISFMEFILVFISIWVIWRAITFYCDRYEENTVRHRLLMFAVMIPVGLMAFAVSDVEKHEYNFFFVAFIVSRLVLIYLWLTVQYQTKEQRSAHSTTMFTFLLSSLLIALALFIPHPLVYIVWLLVLIFELFHPLLTIYNHQKLPAWTKTHLPERFGLFIILVLGEVVLAIIHGSKEVETFSTEHIVSIVLSIFIVFMFWWIYFDHVISRSIKNSAGTVLFWGILNLPVAISLILLRTFLVQLLMSEDKHIPLHVVWLGVCSVGLFLLFVAALGFFKDHGAGKEEYRLLTNVELAYLFTKLVSACLLISVPLLLPVLRSWQLLLLICAILAINLVQGLYYRLKSAMEKPKELEMM